MKQYVMGVDGGNSKTDYYLFDIEGNFVDSIRGESCSHERLKDGYAGSYRIMKIRIMELLERNNLTMAAVAAGAFGLAGVDVRVQRENLESVVRDLGFKQYAVDNDAFLGIKAGTTKGYGVCSINGTGTVAGGIDASGQRLQIGGIGEVTGDEAGGAYMTRKLFRVVYDSLYRSGERTLLKEPVMALLKVTEPCDYVEAVSKLYATPFSHTEYIKLVFEYADKNDFVAHRIIANMGEQLARSTAGCINHLNFEEEEVEVVLAGSVWVKPQTKVLFNGYKKSLESFITHRCQYHLLQVPPVIGAVLWALEIATGEAVSLTLREKVMRQMLTR
ncbi:MAG: N-acetylglucosamine kinase [Cellulosilyticaceae bacterium]